MIIGEAPTVLTELEHKVFGDLKIRYANKKLAKSAAAKAVMEYLMEKDPVLASGKDTVLQPPSPGGKKKKGLEAKSSSKVVEVPSEMGYREKLNCRH